MANPKIVFVRKGGKYKVKQTVGTLRHEVGELVSKEQINDLIISNQFTIVTQEK